MASPPVNQHCANCIDALSFPVVHFRACARWFDGECNCSGAAEWMIMTCNREMHYRRLQSPDALMMKLRCIHRGRPIALGFWFWRPPSNDKSWQRTWHYPHLLLDYRMAGRATIDRYLLPATPTCQQQQQRCAAAGWGTRTDGRKDGRTPDRCIDPAPHTIYSGHCQSVRRNHRNHQSTRVHQRSFHVYQSAWGYKWLDIICTE